MKQVTRENARVFQWNPQTFLLPSNSNSDFAMNRFLISSFALLLSLSPVNADTAPAGTDKAITVMSGSIYTFTDADWGFIDSGDSPPNNFSAVKLTSLPTAGTLRVDGVSVSGGALVSRLPQFGATWTPRLIGGRNHNSVASSADGTKLVTTGEYLYTSTDSGVTWTARMTDTNRSWYSVASSADGMKLVAAFAGGQLYTSTDSGVTWTARMTDSSRYWYSVASSADGTKLVAAVYGGLLYTSTDSGVTWTARMTDSARWWGEVVSSADGTKLVAAVYDGQLYTSTDSGVTWMARVYDRWSSVASSEDGTKLVAVAYSGMIYTSTDSGVSWIARMTDSNRLWRSVASSADGTKLVAAAESGLFTSTDSGVSWVLRSSNSTWSSIASSADGGKLVAVTGDQLFTSVLGPPVISYTAPPSWLRGQQTFTFQVQDDGAGNNLDLSPNTITFDVFSLPALITPTNDSVTSDGATLGGNVTSDGGLEVVDRGVVYSAWNTNSNPQIGGAGVTKVAAAGNMGVFTVAVSGLAGSTGYAFAAYATNSLGTAYSMVSSFVTLSAPPAGTDKTITVAAGATYTFTNADWGFTDTGDSSPNDFVAVKLLLPPAVGILQVDGQDVFNFPTTTPISTAWTARMTDQSRSWLSVASSADGTKLVAAESNFFDSGSLYISTNSGVTWTARESGRQWSSVASSADGSKLVAAGSGVVQAGLLYTSTDSGVTWTARMTDSLRYWNSVASSADGTKLVAADYGLLFETNGGLLYTSTDSGVTWTARMTDINRAWSSVASSADGSMLLAAESGGQLYTSTDSGATWVARMTDINRTWGSVASSADGSKLLAANNGGQLYVSTNSGITWTAQDFSRNWQSVAISADGSKLVAAEYGGQLYTSTGNPTQVISYTAPMTLGQQSFTFQVQDDGVGNNLDLSPNTITFNVITPVENWRQTHFGSSLNIGTAADTGDFDGDGVVNLLEFAFGTGPSSLGSGRASLNWNGTFASASLGSTGQPVAAVESGGSGPEYRALFIRRTDYATAGLSYTVHFSSDLFTWGDSTATPTTLSSSGGYDLVGVPFPSGMQFCRVGVTLTP